jgi:16S rRNA (cytosine967-C5)-methyltransferase
MTPAARLQATIELWDLLWHDPKMQHLPMDKIVGDYLRNRRYIGSKDRRDIAARIYGVMRHYARLTWWIEKCDADTQNPRLYILTYEILINKQAVDSFEDLFTGEQHTPDALTQAETDAINQLSTIAKDGINDPQMDVSILCECPAEHYDDLKGIFGDDTQEELLAMTQQAHLHLRVNTRRANRIKVKSALEKEDIQTTEGEISAQALRLRDTAQLSQSEVFKKGWIEIQDEGSQAIALACAAQPGMQILDYCAGGGGKTLALADVMDGKGRIVAMDNNTRRLVRGKNRYIKADIHNVELRSLEDERHRKWIKRQKDKFDVVLVDAPCSGSGTWRRNPDLRWRTQTQPALSDTVALQQDILGRVAAYVKHGGALVYATCSLLTRENEGQIEAFLKNNPDFRIESLEPILTQPENAQTIFTTDGFMRLTPHRHGTDGFFAARLVKSE